MYDPSKCRYSSAYYNAKNAELMVYLKAEDGRDIGRYSATEFLKMVHAPSEPISS
jgi:hypothetical protein